MTDFYTQVGDRNTQHIDKRRNAEDKTWLKILLAIVGVAGTIIGAIISAN